MDESARSWCSFALDRKRCLTPFRLLVRRHLMGSARSCETAATMATATTFEIEPIRATRTFEAAIEHLTGGDRASPPPTRRPAAERDRARGAARHLEADAATGASRARALGSRRRAARQGRRHRRRERPRAVGGASRRSLEESSADRRAPRPPRARAGGRARGARARDRSPTSQRSSGRSTCSSGTSASARA